MLAYLSTIANHKWSTVYVTHDKSSLVISLAYRLQNSPANGKQGPVPEDMSQTLLTNKQGKMRLPDATNIVKPT
jgi:hypothetical protein